MRRFPDQVYKKTRIEIIPMIDVMMFLLVFFVLLGINVIPANGIQTKLPASSTASPIKPLNKVLITLTADGITQVGDQIVDNMDELKQVVLKLKSDSPEKLTVFINGDESVGLQRLVDVMDALKSSGINSITIVSKKK